jgi:hypothetical protein
VLDPGARHRLADILAQELADPSAWELGPDGSYRQGTSLAIGEAGTAQTMAMDYRSEEEVVWAG